MNPCITSLDSHQEFSPGVRRMTAEAGSDSNFDLAREQIELPAGIKLITEPVVSVRLRLPIPVGAPIPVLYVEIDGAGSHAVKKGLQGRACKN
ncbi:MAG: hypothetical protein LC126_07510 [Bryobacterales bacterium]|nr:hypothetical protein [Bryobacterales bacterium]